MLYLFFFAEINSWFVSGNRMKTFVFLCVVAAAWALREPAEKTCTEAPEMGPCYAYFPMFYYDPETNTCKSFVYGGCRGNGNRYATEESCLKNCAVQQAVSDTPDCNKEPDAGLCDAYFPRFYYDQEEGKCKMFVYGGCGGNTNNFETREECLSKCALKAALDRPDCDKGPEAGLCDAYIPRYYYDQKEGMCKEFIYGGCGGNRNNFVTEEECYNKCGALKAALDRPDCDKEPEVGLCDAIFHRYYYDQQEGTCKKFVYGGCGGNSNNFRTEAECYNKCGALRVPSTCEQEKVVGPCKGAFQRFYFNKETKQCESFIYGGCGGNDNNFQRKEVCEALCVVSRDPKSPAECSLKQDTGPCTGQFPRFYYDAKSGTCKEFIYGGCGGNDNNFETEGQCLDVCSN